MTDAYVSSRLVEILHFDGCPNYAETVALVRRVARQLGVAPVIRTVRVQDAAAAAALRFLGSPTVRVDGHDVEPGAEQRHDFAFACRAYRNASGYSGHPDEAWIRDALGVAT